MSDNDNGNTPANIPATGETPTPGGKRRRFFKRLGIATLIGGIAAGIGFKAFANGGHGCYHRTGFMAGPMDPAALEQNLDRFLKHAYVEIDATAEQKERLGPLVKQAAKDLLPLRDKMREAHARGIELLNQPVIDRAALEQLRAGQMQLAEAGSKRLTQALADIAEVLTPAQRKDLAERMERRRGWHRG
jgi:protein CpxP